MTQYTCEHFIIQELVPPSIYKKRGEAAWELLDDRALMMLDKLRKKFGPAVVNTWHSKTLTAAYGKRTESGLRVPGMKHYSNTSQHSYGRAFDVLFKNYTAEQVREYIQANPGEFPYITSIELGVNWLHFDCRNCDPIKAFYP